MSVAAVVLAAGRGSRLGSLTDECPKPLLTVGGRAILTRALGALAAAGVQPIVVVAGYRLPQIVTEIAAHDLPATIVTNADWAVTGSAASLRVGLAALPREVERVLIIEADVVFDPVLLEPLLRDDAANVLLVSPARRGLEGSHVAIDGDGWISRWEHRDDGAGASPVSERAKTVNLSAVTRRCISRALLPALDEVLAEDPRAPLERAFSAALVHDDARLLAVAVSETSWCEVDDDVDLRTARERAAFH